MAAKGWDPVSRFLATYQDPREVNRRNREAHLAMLGKVRKAREELRQR